MKQRISLLAVLALAQRPAAAPGSPDPRAPSRARATGSAPGDPADTEQAGRRVQVLCKLEGASPPA